MRLHQRRAAFCGWRAAWAVALAVGASIPALAPAAEGDIGFLRGKKIAVRVFAETEAAKECADTARSRLEEILADNEIAVLDEEKTKELSDVDKILEDPTAFVTAEFLVEMAEKFRIDGLMAVCLSAEVGPGLADYHSAAAHADVRFIDNGTAQVRSFSPPPMGTRGFPASEGSARSSALLNAAQRAVEEACGLAGLRIDERTRCKSVEIQLVQGAPYRGAAIRVDKRENDRSLWPLAALEDEMWRTETPTCTARAPAGGLAAVAGYIRDTDMHRRPERLYGSRVHVVDAAAGRALLVFECSSTEELAKNTKQVLACAFIGGWRYLCAATGNHLFLWDTETGREIAKLPVPGEPVGLAWTPDETGGGIVLQTRNGTWDYRLMRRSP